MIKRTIDISEGPTFLHIENDQLVIERDKARVGSVPCEDLGMLLIDNRATTLSVSAVTRLAEYGAAVVFCDEKHLPAAIAIPAEANNLLAERVRLQAECPLPRKKRLWQQIVQEKIARQAANLDDGNAVRRRMLTLVDEVRSGDTSNCEGRAAGMYWPAVFGADFRRNPDGEPPNGLLNYGYMVMRAAVARALAGAGLCCALGLHHRNRSNAFCLADDLVEPLRPAVDRVVLRLWRQRISEVDRPAKAELLGLMAAGAVCGEERSPLMVALHRMAASLVACLVGERDELMLPVVGSEGSGPVGVA